MRVHRLLALGLVGALLAGCGKTDLAKKAEPPQQPASESAENTAPSGGSAPPDDGATRGLERPTEATPPPSPAPSAPGARDEKPKDRNAGRTGAPRGPAPQPPPAAAPADEAWEVIPVYFGTDRAKVPNDKRLDYGSQRGRKLELGRAMISVPKAHVQPAIERPWTVTIPYLNVTVYEEAEDPKTHFTVQEIKALNEGDFLTLVKERLAASARFKDHAFIFVHGYNTTFDYAIYRVAQIAYDLKFDGAPFAYSWPSGGGLASYTYDRESSGQAEPYLKEFIELVINKTGAKHVSLIAHSMGNQPVLRVLEDLRRATPNDVKLSQIILAAPDVDRDNFENIAAGLKGLSKGITLYAAANDKALQVSRNFNGGVPRAGDVPAGGPLVLSGVDTIDATAASMDSLGLHHSGYAESNALLSDIGLLIQTGERPPSNRTPILEQVTSPNGQYWRYPTVAR